MLFGQLLAYCGRRKTGEAVGFQLQTREAQVVAKAEGPVGEDLLDRVRAFLLVVRWCLATVDGPCPVTEFMALFARLALPQLTRIIASRSSCSVSQFICHVSLCPERHQF
jgi:hypothetical protein